LQKSRRFIDPFLWNQRTTSQQWCAVGRAKGEISEG
jgi:hypothetical protein